MLVGESTVWPSREVMVSPLASPALAAGPPLTTPLTATPEVLGVTGASPPKSPPAAELPLLPLLPLLPWLPELDSSTPRKAVEPTWVVVVPLPDSIWWAIARASLIGMA